MSSSQAGGSGLSVAIGVFAIFGCGVFVSFYLTNLVRVSPPSERPAFNGSLPEPAEVSPPSDCVTRDVDPKTEGAEEPSENPEGGPSP